MKSYGAAPNTVRVEANGLAHFIVSVKWHHDPSMSDNPRVMDRASVQVVGAQLADAVRAAAFHEGWKDPFAAFRPSPHDDVEVED